MGGGGQSSTTIPQLPPEFAPLVNNAVGSLVNTQGRNPLWFYGDPHPLQIAPESQYTLAGYQYLPQTGAPLPGQQYTQNTVLPNLQGINQQYGDLIAKLGKNPTETNPYL